jgi:hypothetical protein
MAYLKKDAPAEIVEILRQVEAQADECWRVLQILQNPSNVGVPECSLRCQKRPRSTAWYLS